MSFTVRLSDTLPLLVTFIRYWTMPPCDAICEVRLTCSVVALALQTVTLWVAVAFTTSPLGGVPCTKTLLLVSWHSVG